MILLLTETLAAGGAEIFVLRLARQLNQMGLTTVIFNLNGSFVNTDLVSKYTDLKIVHASLPLDFFLRKIDRLFFKLKIDISIRDFFLSKAINLLIKDSGIRAVHSHLFKADYFFSKINRKYRLRHIITNHGDYHLFNERAKSDSKERILNFEEKASFVFAEVTSIVCISHNQKDAILRIYGEQLNNKIKIIYNGYSVESFQARSRSELQIESKSIVFGMVARGIEEKGWRFAIDAFNKLKNPNCHLLLVGEGEYLRLLRDEIDSHPNIHWVGFSKNPLEWITIFDVGLLPSYYHAESQPNVVLECLSQGKPVICSDVGDMKLILNTSDALNQCGFTLPIRKSKPEIDSGELSLLMRNYLDDFILLKKHSVNAWTTFRNFELTICAQHYIQEYSLS